MKKSILSLAAMGAFLLLVGCAGDQPAPTSSTTTTTEETTSTPMQPVSTTTEQTTVQKN